MNTANTNPFDAQSSSQQQVAFEHIIPNGESLIQLDGITKVFYTDELETHALSNIHLAVRKGEFISIAGPSGSGKTTLLSILGLLDSFTQGIYLLGGKSVGTRFRFSKTCWSVGG